MNAEILKCDCKHHSQDKLHGDGMRVHNPSTKCSVNESAFTCTVCGSVKRVGGRSKK